MSNARSKVDAKGLPSHIDHLTPDPKQARRRTERNLGMIEAALREVGWARSTVSDETGRLLAGNGAVEAARSAGLIKVRSVEADGDEIINVVRRGLTEDQKVRLALYDNRAAELAEWDPIALVALGNAGIDLESFFTSDELTKVLSEIAVRQDPGAGAQLGGMAYKVIIDCTGEEHQAQLLERFEKEGLTCRALIQPE